MNDLIKVSYLDEESYIKVSSITRISPTKNYTEIRSDGEIIACEQTPEEILEMIEKTKWSFKDCLMNNGDELPTPEQQAEERELNIYYRTEDRLPTREDADDGEELLVSEDRRYWYLAHYMKVKDSKYLFWAPVPKVEVRE